MNIDLVVVIVVLVAAADVVILVVDPFDDVVNGPLRLLICH